MTYKKSKKPIEKKTSIWEDTKKLAKKTKEEFLLTKGFNSKQFFKNSIGISRDLNKEPIDLILKFSRFNAPYILSKPLHNSQKIIEQTKDYLIISIKVFESFELNMAILSYGSGVEVLSPKSYIDYLKSEINCMQKIYNKCN
jgi:predicted DNA-binding transcriptional regulator YafY